MYNRDMNPTVTAIRALGAEYAKRMLVPPILIGAVFSVALLILVGWLTTQSAWWWILESCLFLGTVFTLLVTVS